MESNVNLVNLFPGSYEWSPEQTPISESDISDLLHMEPRRSDGTTVYLNDPAGTTHTDWGLVFPFKETYWNVIGATGISATNIWLLDGGPRCAIFFPGVEEGDDQLVALNEQRMLLTDHVVIRDCMAGSFALSMNHVKGPDSGNTEICKLRDLVDSDYEPTTALQKSAFAQLVDCLEKFAKSISCLKLVDCVVAVPPKTVSKPFHLPRELGVQLANRLNIADSTGAVVCAKDRVSFRNMKASEKLSALVGSNTVDPSKFEGKYPLIIDDMYVSGTSMNHTAMLLMQNGAEAVFGLSLLKSLRNDDNPSSQN